MLLQQEMSNSHDLLRAYHVQVKGLDPPVHLQNRIKKNPKSTKKRIRAINISKKTPVIGSVTISSNWILSLLKLFSLESLILERLSLGLNGNCKICIRFTEENHYFKRSHLQPSHEPKRISYSPVRLQCRSLHQKCRSLEKYCKMQVGISFQRSSISLQKSCLFVIE